MLYKDLSLCIYDDFVTFSGVFRQHVFFIQLGSFRIHFLRMATAGGAWQKGGGLDARPYW